ncbi:E3 ubiquitin-protein ligase TRIM71-like [Pocillopora damicornis]|uniref:E3 ubiquitin-protein ligase TRIM71-like n=1 Tax=Pocillopora damicornis TaxID=46731 RepID=UPI000F54F38F|nr:E3 ubiquitin-protein ligase TRIM71-like [Pocillopora damicornis]
MWKLVTFELEFFCKDCCVAICHSCVVTTHDGHAKMLLEEAANERKLQAKSAIENQRKTALAKRREIARLDSDCAKIQEHVASVKKSVQQFVDNMMAVIEAQKQETFDDLDNRAAESMHWLRIQRGEIEKQVKITETSIEATEAILQRNMSAEIIQSNQIIEETFQGQVEPVYPRIGNESIADFGFVRNQRLFDHVWTDRIGFVKVLPTSPTESSASGKGISKPTIGLEANIMLTTRNAKGEQCYEERDYVTVEIKNQEGRDCATETRVLDNKDGSYKISYFAKDTGKCRVSVKVNGEHIRNSPCATKVKPRQFRPVLSFGKYGSVMEDFRCPWGVAVNERDEILVTDNDNNRVQLFSSDGTYLRSFGSKGDKEGEFNSPIGVAIGNENGIIFIADSANHRIQIFSGRGEFLSKFGGKGNLDHQLSYPYGLSIGSDGNCIVADILDNKDGSYKISYFAKKTGKCRVSVKINGEHIRQSPFAAEVKPRQFRPVLSFGKYGLAEEDFSCPWEIAVNELDEIAVTDIGYNKVQVFSSDGTYLRSFGSRGYKEGEFNSPTGIAIDNESGIFFIADSVTNQIRLFTGKGEFLNKFGGEENLDDQLSYHCGLSFGSDGNYIVADSGNEEINVFSRNGQFLRSIGSEGSLSTPTHCIQYKEYFIASDFSGHCIKVFDKAGHFLYKFGKYGTGDGEFNGPTRLSINKAEHLMVCDADNHRIQVFEVNGKFVGKFGSEGNKIGQLRRPISTAVLSNGRIVVTDSHNHRVQIFE